MWEDAGEEDDCDFADDDVDGRDSGDPEVKELMSEILGKEEADEVLHQVRYGLKLDISNLSHTNTSSKVNEPQELEKARVHLPELTPQSRPLGEKAKNKVRSRIQDERKLFTQKACDKEHADA